MMEVGKDIAMQMREMNIKELEERREADNRKVATEERRAVAEERMAASEEKKDEIEEKRVVG
jgi:hypothetical protein